MWPYRHAGAGRRELGRVVLVSLADTARAELDACLERGQRLRARRAARRLAELEAALECLEQGAPPLERPWYARPGVELGVALAFLASLGGLAATVAVRGPQGLLVGALDVLMLVATVAWFTAAIGRRAARPQGGATRPSNEGSPSPGGGR